jgi:hypothetical protein
MVAAAPASFSLFGSKVALEIVAMLVKIVPAGDAGGMFTVREKAAELPEVNVAIVQVTVPFVPTAGVEQRNAGPEFCCRETNVMPGGRGSLRDADAASSGPPLVTFRV